VLDEALRALKVCVHFLREATFLTNVFEIQAKRMVVGHTPQLNGKILPRCRGRVYVIDVGISRVYGGNHAALDILPDGTVRAIYPNKAPVPI
jgi:hypothetical protein